MFNTNQDSFGEEEGKGIGLSIVIVDYKILVKRKDSVALAQGYSQSEGMGKGSREARIRPGMDGPWIFEKQHLRPVKKGLFSTESAKGCGCVFICFT